LNIHFGFPPPSLGPCWLTIGNFDGVHRGHRKVLDRLTRRARRDGAEAVVLTFDPHPTCILKPDRCPLSLTTVDEKASILADLGVDHLIVVPFTRKLSLLTASEFMDRLRARVQLTGMVIGHDFAFGHQRRGNREFIENYGYRHDFAVDLIVAASRQGKIISSSAIRTLLLDGNVAQAARLLGRHYSINSYVEGGTRTGSRIGFPTANLAITPNKLVPQKGVYAVWADLKNGTFAGAMNVGYRPTFGETRLTVEVFIFDFDRDIYREALRARFVQRIRDEKRFAGPDELVAQIEKDVRRARVILKRPG
jgi:riboflavin kinase/FMN adenylyltransferase